MGACHSYFQRISFLSFVVVMLFFVEADNMHDDVSVYLAPVYQRREPVLVMKFKGKSNSMNFCFVFRH